MGNLAPLEIEVIKLRFGFYDGKRYTLRQIGKMKKLTHGNPVTRFPEGRHAEEARTEGDKLYWVYAEGRGTRDIYEK